MIRSNLKVWLVVALSFVCIGSEVGAQSLAELQRLAEELRSKSDYPGVWLASGEVGGTVQIAASGLRKADSPVPVAPLDRLHIGSCTKAMTAVLMPTSSPRLLMRAPPELPTLIGASVWMKFS